MSLLQSTLNTIGFQQYANIDAPDNVTTFIVPTKAEFDILTTNTGVSTFAKNTVKAKMFLQPVNPGLYVKFHINNIDVYKRLIMLNQKDNSFETNLINNVAEYNKKHSLVDQNTLLNYCTDLKTISLTHVGELFVHGINDLSKYTHPKYDIMANKPNVAFSVIIIDKNKKTINIESKQLIVTNSISNAINSSSIDLLDIDLFGSELNTCSLRSNVLTAVLQKQDTILQKLYHRLGYWFNTEDVVMKSIVCNPKYTDKVTAAIVMVADPELIAMNPSVTLDTPIPETTNNAIIEFFNEFYKKPFKQVVKKYTAPVNSKYKSTTDIYNDNINLIKDRINMFIEHVSSNNIRNYKYAHFVLRYHIVKYCGLFDINYVTNLLCKLEHTTHIDYIAEYIHKLVLREYNIVINELTEDHLSSSAFMNSYMVAFASIIAIRDQV